MRENEYQARLIKKLKAIFPGIEILKNDEGYKQGIPDLLLLYKGRWAGLEVKRSKSAPYRPNQEYYVNKWNEMSYAAFIYPENEADILDELQQTLQA